MTQDMKPGRWTAWDEDTILGTADQIEQAVDIVDRAAGRAPRSSGRMFVVTNSIGVTAYATKANGREPELPAEHATRQEQEITDTLDKARELLRARDYGALQEALMRASFAANTLALLGPQGSDSIPVDAERDPIDEVEAYRG